MGQFLKMNASLLTGVTFMSIGIGLIFGKIGLGIFLVILGLLQLLPTKRHK